MYYFEAMLVLWSCINSKLLFNQCKHIGRCKLIKYKLKSWKKKKKKNAKVRTEAKELKQRRGWLFTPGSNTDPRSGQATCPWPVSWAVCILIQAVRCSMCQIFGHHTALIYRMWSHNINAQITELTLRVFLLYKMVMMRSGSCLVVPTHQLPTNARASCFLVRSKYANSFLFKVILWFHSKDCTEPKGSPFSH